MSDVIGLVLAAGASRRLGRPKALVRLPTGETLLSRAVRVVREAGLLAHVTVSPDAADVIAAAGQTGAAMIQVPDAAGGMSASIRAGAAFARVRSAEGLLVLLVDQWRVDAADLVRLMTIWRDDPTRLVAAAYADTVGAPAVFGHATFDTLSRLQGDAGARDYLREPANNVQSINLPHAAIDLDVIADTAT